MKRHLAAWTAVAVILFCAFVGNSRAQQTSPFHVHYKSIPLHGSDETSSGSESAPAAPEAAAAAAVSTTPSTVPLWKYTTTASRNNGKTYSGTMVGRSPFFHGARTTNVNTILVPVTVTIVDRQKNRTTFDPTQPDPACLPNGTLSPAALLQQSPLLTATNFTMNGVTEEESQYVDAFQRANFFEAISQTGNRYHTRLNLLNTVPVSITISAPSGLVFDTSSFGGCEPIAVVNVSALQKIAEKTLIPKLKSQGVGPTTFPIFLFYNVVMNEGNPTDPPNQNCCILGFHSAIGSASKPQLYSVGDYDSSGIFLVNDAPTTLDTQILSHELAELTDDPLVNNPTPAWGHVGQVSGCQGNLEVGDPLSGMNPFPPVTMPNGVTYDLQQLAFFSWFFGSPSIGAGGSFSDNGTFNTDAGTICR